MSVKGHKGVLGLETGMKELSARVATCAGASAVQGDNCVYKSLWPQEQVSYGIHRHFHRKIILLQPKH